MLQTNYTYQNHYTTTIKNLNADKCVCSKYLRCNPWLTVQGHLLPCVQSLQRVQPHGEVNREDVGSLLFHRFLSRKMLALRTQSDPTSSTEQTR